MRQVGISPKAAVAGFLPFIAGLVLLLLDKLVAGDSVPDEIWATLLAAAPVTGGGAFLAGPGEVERKP